MTKRLAPLAATSCRHFVSEFIPCEVQTATAQLSGHKLLSPPHIVPPRAWRTKAFAALQLCSHGRRVEHRCRRRRPRRCRRCRWRHRRPGRRRRGRRRRRRRRRRPGRWAWSAGPRRALRLRERLPGPLSAAFARPAPVSPMVCRASSRALISHTPHTTNTHTHTVQYSTVQQCTVHYTTLQYNTLHYMSLCTLQCITYIQKRRDASNATNLTIADPDALAVRRHGPALGASSTT